MLQEPIPGPFGVPVQTFNLPSHLFWPGDGFPTKEDIIGASADTTPGASHCTSVSTVSSTIAKDCDARIDPVANDTKHA